MIGNIFDPNKPEDDNTIILKSIFEGSNSIEDLFKRIKRYAGRFSLIYRDTKHYIIFQDFLGIRAIYYSTQGNRVLSESPPNLLAKFADPQIEPAIDHELTDFYNNHFKFYTWIGV
jgi:asparagine synthetase B (glutamine-hydrolysing)